MRIFSNRKLNNDSVCTTPGSFSGGDKADRTSRRRTGGENEDKTLCRLTGDNSGATLVELIVSILILAIIFTPVFTSFLTALHANKKAQQLMNAETAAANIMEEVKFLGYDGMKTNAVASNGAIVAGQVISGSAITVYAFGDDTNTFKKKNIREGSNSFDVEVTFDRDVKANAEIKNGVAATGAAATINDYRFADMSDLNKNSTALINPVAESIDYDNMAVEYFYNCHIDYQRRTPGITLVSWDQIKSKMRKTMTLGIEHRLYDGRWYYIVNSSLIYTLDDVADNIVSAGQKTREFTNYCDEVVFDELKTIYLMYSPITAETISPAGKRELNFSLGIENVDIRTTGLIDALDIYIVVQAQPDTTINGTLKVNENEYSKANVFCQAKTNVQSVSEGRNENLEAVALAKKGELSVERVYEVTVKIKDHDSGETVTSVVSTVGY